jgi:hypothetical protein
MKYKPLSSCEGLIQKLLITTPQGSQEIIDQYYAEITNAFVDRDFLVKFENYEPPRNEGQKLDQEIAEEGELEEMLSILMRRQLLIRQRSPSFDQEYIGPVVEALTKGTPIIHSEWAQDPFVVLQNDRSEGAFLQPLYSKRYMDKFISLQLAAWPELDMMVKPTELLIEGGNVLAYNDLVLIGKDTLAQNLLRLLQKMNRAAVNQEIRSELQAEFKRQLGIDNILWVGFDHARACYQRPEQETFQPAFHLDLFLTAGGKNEKGEYVLFLGNPQLALNLLEGRVPATKTKFPAIAEANFKEIRKWFKQFESGAAAREIPLHIVDVPIYFFHDILFSFNNGLVEGPAAQKTAYLPTYRVGLAEDKYESLNDVFDILEPEVERIFTDNGFKRVNWIGPGKFMRKLSMMRGSLHCITKVLARSQSHDT